MPRSFLKYLNRWLSAPFNFEMNQTSGPRELMAGLTTFVTMAYIVIIEPQMLQQAGMNLQGSFLVVALVTAFSSILCGLISNLPFAMAPGLGLLSFFSYVVVQKMGLSYQVGLAAVFISGLLFFLISLTKVRQMILEAIPHSLGCAIAAGIGFFIGLIALRNTHLIISSPVTLVQLGMIDTPSILLFFLGFLVIAILDRKNIPGAILIGMFLVTVLGLLFHVSHFHGIFSSPLANSSDFHVGEFNFHFLFLNIKQAWPLVFTFLIVALFDSTGTMLGLSHQMGQEKLPMGKINRALLAESIATSASSLVGGTTIAAFVESAAGVRVGGRTGLTAVTVGILFLMTLFFYPLAESVPDYATACGLFYVSCMMIKPFAKVDWDESSEFIPAVITLLMIPLTFSIADGVGLGLICYVILKVAAGKLREIRLTLWALTLIFVIYFIL
jgi:AGZA family xanthine/uracil permease-like MFS transporter